METRQEDTSRFDVRADAYDGHIGRYSEELAQGLIGVAGIERGQRVLDVGCGPGAVTSVLAARLGAENVAAVDPSSPFVAACRAGVPGADVREAAAERLPHDDDSFDATVSQLVLNFMADAPGAVSEMRRVTRPGGVVAAAVWDYADGMTLLRAFWDAARAVDPQAADSDEGEVMRYCSRTELEALWREAGLDDVATGELHATAHYADYDDLWHSLETGAGPASAYAALDADRRARLRPGLRERLGSPSGAFTLDARAWYVLGRA
jgi:ubiquinone/menaquinone biosynthesis C-methylase UbiE